MPEGTRRARKARSGGAKSFHSVEGSLGTDEVSGCCDPVWVIASANILILRLPSNTKTPLGTNGRKKNASAGPASLRVFCRLQKCAAYTGGEHLEGFS